MENFTEEEILEYFEDCFQNGDSTVKKIQNLRGRMAKWYFYNTYRDIFMVKYIWILKTAPFLISR